MKSSLKFVLMIIALLMWSVVSAADEAIETDSPDSAATANETEIKVTMGEKIIAYYFHGNQRCATCMKLEAFSSEAITGSFASQLADSSIVWRVVNFDEKENEHFAKEYQLYSQSLVLSRVRDGKEEQWKNLDKIWQLVGNEEAFIAYVRSELQIFMGTATE